MTDPRIRTLFAILSVATLALAGAAISQRARETPQRDGPIVRAARQVEGRLARLEIEVARLKALHEEPVPPPETEPPPDPPPRTRPTRPPPGTEPPPPSRDVLRASWRIDFGVASTYVDGAVAEDGTIEVQAGPFWLAVIWEDFDRDGYDEDDPFTAFLINGQAGAGTVRWQSLELRVSGEPLLDEGAGLALPRGALIRSTIGLDDWRLLPETADLPQWARAKALTHKGYAVGPYRFHVDESDPQAPAGRAIAPYHGGRRDWLATCAEGRHYRWRQAVGAMSRAGVWMLEADGSPWLPGPHGTRYSWDASALEYALPGWRWDADQGWAYETALRRQRLTDMSHGRRWYGAVAANAEDCRAARYMLMTACWPEVKRSYSLDKRVPATSSPDERLYSPLWQILELTKKGPHASWGNRREAHAIALTCEAEPYMEPEDRQYLAAFAQLAVQLDDGRGVLDHSCNGDAYLWATKQGGKCPAQMAFQAQLMSESLRWLGETKEGRKAAKVSARMRAWLGPNPPYYTHSGDGAPIAMAALHSANAAVKDYSWFTHPETADWNAIVKGAASRGLGESPLDCVGPEVRNW